MDDEQQVQGQVERARAAGAFVGGGTLFTEPVLVVNQKTKLIELTNEYKVFDASGKHLGAVRQTGQSTLKKAARLFTSLDQFLTHKLEITDASGATQLTLTVRQRCSSRPSWSNVPMAPRSGGSCRRT